MRIRLLAASILAGLGLATGATLAAPVPVQFDQRTRVLTVGVGETIPCSDDPAGWKPRQIAGFSRDVEAVADAAARSYKQPWVTKLMATEATLAKVREQLAQLKETSTSLGFETVIFHFSGFADEVLGLRLYDGWLRSSELQELCGNRILMVLDSAHAARFGVDIGPGFESAAVMCVSPGSAPEEGPGGTGLLTGQVVKGMLGYADADGDGLVSAAELAVYAQRIESKTGQHTTSILSGAPFNVTVSQVTSRGAHPLAAAPPRPSPTGRRLALLIGVKQYQNQVRSLRYTLEDVRALEKSLLRENDDLDPLDLVVLADDSPVDTLKPTKKNIEHKMRSFLSQRAREDDTVLIFFAGHGDVVDGTPLLLPQDYDPDAPTSTGISVDDFNAWVKKIPARKKVVILDACYSGGFSRGGSVSQLNAAAEGEYRFCACRDSQESQESPELKHGVFSYYLCQALEGAADLNRDGRVSMNEVNTYVTQEVSAWAEKHHRLQNPKLFGSVSGEVYLSTVEPLR